jgi:hypothetical protein
MLETKDVYGVTGPFSKLQPVGDERLPPTWLSKMSQTCRTPGGSVLGAVQRIGPDAFRHNHAEEQASPQKPNSRLMN